MHLACRGCGGLGAFFFTNRRRGGHRFLGSSSLHGLTRIGRRAFLGSGSSGWLVLACHGSEMAKRDDPLCAGLDTATQGAPKQSAQFYLTDRKTPNSVATHCAHSGSYGLT